MNMPRCLCGSVAPRFSNAMAENGLWITCANPVAVATSPRVSRQRVLQSVARLRLSWPLSRLSVPRNEGHKLMPFASGSITFRRFLVMGKSPKAVDQDLLDKLAGFALKERDLGVPDEEEYGWSGGRHILDANFSFENNVFADALVFGLRIDTNKVPGE